MSTTQPLSLARCFAVSGCVLALPACSTSARLSLMPTLDTTRAPGFEATASFAVGLPISKQQAIMAPISVGGGFRKASTVQPVVPVDVGIDYVQLGAEARDLGFRAGLREHSGIYLSGGPEAYGIATQAALLPTVWASPQGGPRASRQSLTVGPAFDAAWMFAKDSPSFGRFGLGLSLEWYNMGSTFLP